MTEQTPGIGDIDLNHPANVEKMKPKSDEYKQYPPPEGNLSTLRN
jgi:hypothetical protein